MTTIKFDDFLENELADNKFKEGFLTEKAILESAIAVYDARQTAGLTQRELASYLMSHSLPLLALNVEITQALKQ